MSFRTLFLFAPLLGMNVGNHVYAAEKEIPIVESEFVTQINNYEKAKIVEQFGEPSMKKDFTTDSGEVFASVWHYHYINTSAEGTYYPTTELDFVNDKVVMVVFMNHDGHSPEATIQPAEPESSEPSPNPKL